MGNITILHWPLRSGELAIEIYLILIEVSSNILSDVLSNIFSDISRSSNILSKVLSGISSDLCLRSGRVH